MTDPAARPHGYEWRAVLLLSLGFGLVGVDRFMISAMYPVIAADLGLGYGDIGVITGVLAIAWGIAALLMGNLSDYIGRRSVLAGSLIVFSLLIGASGLATGLGGLLIVRALMGLADGAYTPPSISATLEASPPARRGRNLGIQQMMLPLFGLGLAPILVTQALEVVSWRWVFAFVALPGLVVAWLLWRTIQNAPRKEAAAKPSLKGLIADSASVLRIRNVALGAAGMLCWLTSLITTSAFLPNYFVDYLHLDGAAMGGVMSAIGLGAMAGSLLLPWLSDRVGRRPVMLVSTLGALGALYLLSIAPADVGALFGRLFVASFFTFALITLTVGPISTESAPPALMATASGVVIGIAELFGGGLAPVIVGAVAQNWGIEHVLWAPMAAMAIGFVLSLALRETAPAVVDRARPAAA